MSLYLKYRPVGFNGFYGNAGIKVALKNILSRELAKIPHAFLFTGASGCGKTTLVRIVKKKMGCSDFDFLEFDSANTRGIDTVREIRANCRIKPMDGELKIYYLDEVHKITNDGQTALLKVLEDTPPHVYFFLTTTDPDKLLLTIRNRCQIFNLLPLSDDDLFNLLNDVLKSEHKKISKEILYKIIENSKGSARQALVYLDSIIDLDSEKNKNEIFSIIEGGIEGKEVVDLCRALNRGNWKEISGILKNLKINDYEKIRYAILGYFNSYLLNSGDIFPAEVIFNFIDSFIYSGKAGLTLACFKSIKRRTR